LKEDPLQFTFDQTRSSIYFLASSTLHPISGKARKFDGRIQIPNGRDPSTGGVTLQIETAALDTNHEARDKKMKECLEVNRFPLIRFKSVEIHPDPGVYAPGSTGRAEVLGLLDLHGVQKKVTLPMEYNYSNELFRGRGKVIVKMSDFQIPEPRVLFLRVKDDIEILFEIEALPAPDPSKSRN
jgi:polyisoprenoid-binding protein YceI